jgi:hypothetical protein
MAERKNIKKLISFLLAIVFLGGILLFGQFFLQQLPKLEREIPALAGKVGRQIATPPPLIAEVRLPESFLTQAGVIKFTNIQRAKQGLPALRENPELNESSLIKTQDMLAKQYFGHISPQGQGVGDLAERTGYEFIALGENLALGDFENDEKLVQGWYESQGHRENILNPQYQEIGVAVLKGEFQGRETWLAVQHFGKPLSACRQPSEEMLAEIKEKQSQIEQLYFALSALEQEINSMRPKRGPVYNQKVEEYNNLVWQYNLLISQTKLLIGQYNQEVRLFNECAKG